MSHRLTLITVALAVLSGCCLQSAADGPPDAGSFADSGYCLTDGTACSGNGACCSQNCVREVCCQAGGCP